MQAKFEQVKLVTTMFHFNTIGCKIGKDALQKKREMVAMQTAKDLESQKKEEAKYNQRKNKFNEIMAKNIPDDKLTITQLKTLLAFKKRKDDPKFSHLNKQQLLLI